MGVFSSKRENTLIYLINAIEKHCKSVGFMHNGIYKKWGSYGFFGETLELGEYYPNATEDTYKGVSGYIYSVSDIKNINPLTDIPFAFTSELPVKVESFEFVPDAYEAIVQAVKDCKITLQRYEENPPHKLEWIRKTIISEYKANSNNPEYLCFLRDKFTNILEEIK